jgi:beta-glucosidase
MSPIQIPENIAEIVESILKQLTLKEKVFLLSGRDSWATMPVNRPLEGAVNGIPVLIMTDGPHGVRANQPDAGRALSGPTTAFPTGVSLASSWNPALVEQVGLALGEETKAMGCDILLGPCVNIVRTPIAGRNFEAYAEDPYLAGRIGVAYVKGVQGAGAGTSLKHFAANNQEIERYRGSSEVDERTLREIYLPHFEMVVKEAQPWTVMCSYNRINGVYASQNHHLLTEILKDEWGFKGLVVSDWTANHTTTESVKGGLDLEMPGPAKWYGPLLMEAVAIWQIEESDIDKAVRRILGVILRSGKLNGTAPQGSVNTPAHQALARQAAEEAITLLKNKNNILPLKPQQIQAVAVIGSAALEYSVSGGGSALVEPPYRVAPLTSLRRALGDQVEIRYETGADNWLELPVLKSAYVTPSKGEGQGLYGEYYAGEGFEGKPLMERIDPRLDFWWFTSGPTEGLSQRFSVRWTGKLEVPTSGRYTLRVQNTGRACLFLDGKQVTESSTDPQKITDVATSEVMLDLVKGQAYDLRFELVNSRSGDFTNVRLNMGTTPAVDDRIEQAVALAKEAEVALVFVGDNEQCETEGTDRPNLRLPGRQDELVQRVAAANPNTVVVLNVGAPVEMPWIDQVAAVVQAYYPGLEGGEAIRKVLTGEVNPSGKLTVTYPKRFEDTPSFTNLSYNGARQVRYGEGIFVGYRYYDSANVEPLFPFGHGLSYTTFEYAHLQAPAEIQAGQSFEVSLDVTNTGPVAGQEVVQLYVRDVACSEARPYKELKGFQKVALKPGETRTVRFTLDPRALSFYDVVRKDWVAEPGSFELQAGSSSRDIRGKVTTQLK